MITTENKPLKDILLTKKVQIWLIMLNTPLNSFSGGLRCVLWKILIIGRVSHDITRP